MTDEFEIGESAYDWDENEDIEGVKKQHEATAAERAKAYHHLFAQDATGTRILTEWVNSYCTNGVPGPNATARECAMRDGKQELIQMIIQQITIATGENR